MSLTFELARQEHARDIQRMRQLAAEDLTRRLGEGHWSRFSKLQSIQERIKLGDPLLLRKNTLYVGCLEGRAVGSVVVSTWPPGFWKREYWQDPKAQGLGVFNLVVFPELQRRGYGRLLMEGVEELAVKHVVPYVRLDAYEDNPISTSFYRAIGYEERRTVELRTVRLVMFEKRVL